MGVGAGLSMYVVVVQKFTFAISSPDEFLFTLSPTLHGQDRTTLPCKCLNVCLLDKMTFDLVTLDTARSYSIVKVIYQLL